jgi:RNA polymerase sigma factor (sigma-70 family)
MLDHRASAHDLTRLVRQIDGGCGASLASLHRHFSRGMLATARRVVQSNECAQEVVADVFIFVWKNSHIYDGERGSVEAWLTIMTRYRAIDCWRRNLKHRLFADHSQPAQDWPGVWQADSLLLSSEDESLVRFALSVLSPLRRRLLEMAFFEGLTHEEIAGSVALPLGTVKSHLRRALRSMRAVMGKNPFDQAVTREVLHGLRDD